MAGKVLTKLPLPVNSKLVTLNVPSTQGGKGPMWLNTLFSLHCVLIMLIDLLSCLSGVVQVQQKVLGIIPTSTAGQQTFTTFQPRTATVSIRPNSLATAVTTATTQQVLH